MDRIEGENVKSLWSRFSKKNRFFEEECLPKLIIGRSIDAASTITFYDHLFFLLDAHHGAPRSLHIFSPHGIVYKSFALFLPSNHAVTEF